MQAGKGRGARTGDNVSWTDTMVRRCYALTEEGLSAAKVAVALNTEFKMSITRNAVLGRLHRDAKAGKPVPPPANPHKVGWSKSGPRAKVRPGAGKKDLARLFDELDLTILQMRKARHKWDYIAAWAKSPVAQVMDRARAIAADDIATGDSVDADWAYVLGSDDASEVYDE